MINKHQITKFIKQNAIIIILMILVLVVMINIISISQQNREFQEQKYQLELIIEKLKLQNRKQQLYNRFLQTDYYKDLAIREQKAFVLEGETVLIINPDKIDDIKQAYQSEPQTVQTSRYKSNMQQWQQFFFNND